MQLQVSQVVEATRDGKLFDRGETGVVEKIIWTNNKQDVFVRLDDGTVVGPDTVAFWKVIG